MNVHSRVKWIFPALCLIIGLLLTLYLHFAFQFSWSDASKEGVLFCIINLAAGGILVWLLKAYTARFGKVAFAGFVGLVLGLGAAFVHVEVVDIFFESLPDGSTDFQRAILVLGPWIDYPFMLVVYSLATTLYEQIETLKRRYALHQDAETLLKEAELFKLRQQLQPHFLYNSLNSISALIILEPAKAEQMVGRLSDFLRSSLKQGKTERIPLSEELTFLQNYLWIESVRFGDRLKVNVQVDEQAQEAAMPPFLLQPVLENAIRFGVYGRAGSVLISVTVSLESELLKIVVSNPFDPDMKAASGTGFGLKGIQRRLYLSYGRQDLVAAEARAEQFVTTILIPQSV